MDKIEALLNEYNNLWNEKLIHKASIRKFHNYITSLTSVGSLVLTFIGLSPIELQKIINKDIATIILIPLVPIIILILSFASNDLFHIYVIGSRIGALENIFNRLFGDEKLFLWEHKICPFIYGGKEVVFNDIKLPKISNIIKISDFNILVPFIGIVGLSSIILCSIFLYKKSCLLLIGYLIIIGVFFYGIIGICIKLLKYTKADSDLVKNVEILSNN